MLAGKRVHREIVIAVVMAMLMVAGAARVSMAQTVADTQKLNYFSNANVPMLGNAFVHVTDPLELDSATTQPEVICAMFYVFNPQQALQECCGCPVTADGLLTLSINAAPPGITDLVSTAVSQATVPPSILQNGTIRILSTTTNASLANPPIYDNSYCTGAGTPSLCCTGTNSGTCPVNGAYCDPKSRLCCDPTGGASNTLTLQPTVRAWATHPQTVALTEEEFLDIPSASTDANDLAALCSDVQQLGTGLGICTCGTGS